MIEKIKNKIPITVDNSPSLMYERKRWKHFLVAPFAFILTFWVAIKKMIFGSKLKTNTFWVDGISPICREVKDTAKGWRAVDILYNYEFGKRTGLEGKIADFWLDMLNAQAMRNRLKLVKQCLKEEIERLQKEKSDIKILSVASGSAQGVIDVLQEFKQKGLFIKVILLDLDPSALEHSKVLARKAGVIEQIKYVNKSARELEEVAKGFNPDIIEIVGFLEYRPQESTIRLVKRSHRLLAPNGVLLTSSVSPNIESLFLHHVVNWPMIHRSLKQFINALIKGGFTEFKIIYEPLKIQKIAVCRKEM